MDKIAVLYSEHTQLVDAIKYNLSDYLVDYLTEVKDLQKYDWVICLKKEIPEGNVIACHHSLLPAFDCSEPEKEAILSGVKVTGITIYYPNIGKIIAQYPVFIKNDFHYDDLKQELTYLEQTIFPLVLEKILKNEAFEINELINKKCNGGCGGCSSCSH